MLTRRSLFASALGAIGSLFIRPKHVVLSPLSVYAKANPDKWGGSSSELTVYSDSYSDRTNGCPTCLGVGFIYSPSYSQQLWEAENGFRLVASKAPCPDCDDPTEGSAGCMYNQ